MSAACKPEAVHVTGHARDRLRERFSPADESEWWQAICAALVTPGCSTILRRHDFQPLVRFQLVLKDGAKIYAVVRHNEVGDPLAILTVLSTYRGSPLQNTGGRARTNKRMKGRRPEVGVAALLRLEHEGLDDN